MWNCYEEGEKKKHLNSIGQVKCEKRVGEEKDLPYLLTKIQQKLSAVKGLNIYTQKRNRLLVFFFVFFLHLNISLI